jgi:quercetin dioxygenase-like cupin family protein
MKKGCAEPLHQHPQEQISYVLSGTFAFTCGDETKILKTGDSVYVGPDVLHNSACIEDGVILAVFSPYRPDFL